MEGWLGLGKGQLFAAKCGWYYSNNIQFHFEFIVAAYFIIGTLQNRYTITCSKLDCRLLVFFPSCVVYGWKGSCDLQNKDATARALELMGERGLCQLP